MKFRNNLALLLLGLCLGMAGWARADQILFDPQPLGTVYGSPVGMAPGDFMFSEGGSNLYVTDFYSGGAPYFNMARIDPAFAGPTLFFGAGHILQVNNVGILFAFSAPGDVTLEFLDLGGSVNLQVNGFGVVMEAGDMSALAGAVAPGVVMNVATVAVPGGHRGTLTLTGPVDKLLIGGQEYWIDDVRNDNGWSPGTGECDYEVNHQTLPLGTTWGSGTHSPGDHIFTEDGIPVFIDIIDWGSGTGFNFCSVEAPGIPDFGFDRVMNINNVSNVYNISALGILVESVSFEFVDFGGLENLQVNGGPLHIGDIDLMPAVVAPGVIMTMTTFPLGGSGIRGEVTLTGNVQKLLLAGQEFMVDNICVVEAGETGTDCDQLSDNESQAPGSLWGAAYGESAGDVIFNEDGIDVGVTWFRIGALMSLYEARTDAPWGPIGSGNVMHLNNISVTYDLTPFSPVDTVTFDYCKGDGTENLGVNGVLYQGDLLSVPAAYFPGVAFSLSANIGPGYVYGTVTLIGDVQRLMIGGQQFYIDNVCVSKDDLADVPEETAAGLIIDPNWPNPFNPSTTLRFRLERPGPTRLSIVDLQGRRVTTLVEGNLEAGMHQAVWDGKDRSGRQAGSGMYFVMLESGEERAMRKISLLK